MAATRQASLSVRWLIRKDLPQILETEIQCHDPHSEHRITSILRQRNCIGMVVTPTLDTEDVRGHFIYELYPKHVLLLRLCVNPIHRQQGIATAALTRLVSKLTIDRRRKIVFPVSERLLPLHNFLRRRGFWATGITREHDGDLYDFEYTLPTADIDEPTHLRRPENRISNYL